MDQGLKERLVGAIVLVLVSVIVIPWVLDGPERRDRTTQAIDLPTNAADDNKKDESRTLRFSLGEDQAEPEAQPQQEAVAGAAPSEPVTETSEPAELPPAAGTGWTVQVGSFSNGENAESLVGTLQANGFEAHVNEHVVDGERRFRVRVGRFERRDQADALAIRIRGETGEPARPVQLP